MPDGPGWSESEALRRLERGEVGFLYLVGHDPGGTFRSRSAPDTAQDDSTFVVVQDPFLTRAARAADVVLPVVMLLERTGRFTAADGLPRWLRRAVPPPADLPQDGQVFAEIAQRCGVPIVTGPALRREMRRLSSDPIRSQVRPRFVSPEPPPTPRNLEPFALDLSPRLFHSGTTTLRSASLTELAPPVSAYVAPADAGRLGISDGTMVRVVEGQSRLLLSARIDATLRHGTVAILPHSLRAHGLELDPGRFTPLQVSVEVV
jgi:anaerobic selenocysteine-containing dehydrogenase